MIPQDLIASSLALTGRTMEDMYIEKWCEWEDFINRFSYPKFYAYILNKNNLHRYYRVIKEWYIPDDATIDLLAWEFWYAIMEHQSWNSQPLIDLLSKI